MMRSAFSFSWVNRVPLDLFQFASFASDSLSLVLLCTQRGVSPGDRGFLAHVSDLKAVFKCSRLLQIGNFAIIKLHEYEASCRIPRMPHGEDLQ